MSLKYFFNPRSIAIIGASNNEKKIGRQILNNIIANGFSGKVYPINLKDGFIAGIKAYKSILDIEKPIDMVVFAMPSYFVITELKSCIQKGIKNIIIISAGFSEIDSDGKEMEEEIKVLAEKHKLNILGPNCLGMINTNDGINISFAKPEIKKGRIAFISQSGAIGSAVLDWVENRNVGFSYFISTGNKAVLGENDFIEYLVKDSNTDAIVIYVESIRNGKKFMEAISKYSKVKPIVVLKAGTTQAGSLAALSHTGKLAGSSEVVKVGLKRSGVIVLNTIEELFNFLKLFQRKTSKTSNSEIFIVSNAGGPTVMSIDQISMSKVELGKFSKQLTDQLKEKLPALVRKVNPLDILGDADSNRYKIALENILADKDVHNILILLTPQAVTEADKTARTIIKLDQKYKDKLICACFLGGASLNNAKQLLKDSDVVNFSFPNIAIKTMAKIIRYKKEMKRNKPYKNDIPSSNFINQGQQMDYLESFKILKKYNIPVITPERLENISKLKYPVALKVVGPNLIHKTDKYGLALNVQNEVEVRKELKKFKTLLEPRNNYCVTQEMVSDAFEIILGFKRDKSFGSIIMVGFGGIYAEVFKDIRFEVDDVNFERAMLMIKELTVYPILAGIRGDKGYDVKALANAIVNLSKLAKENPDIQELDINPLFIKRSGVVAADVRAIT